MPLNTGTYISGGAHLGVIVWALVGGMFFSADDPLPLENTQVSLLTGEQYAALIAPQDAPSVATESPEVEAPVAEDPPDVAPVVETTPAVTPPPEVVEPPVEDIPETPSVEPLPQVVEPGDGPVFLKPPVADTTAEVETTPDDVPKPEEAPRIAPEPAAEVAPDTEIADIVQPEIVAEDQASETVPEQAATAPEEAATEIVTEAEKPAFAPSSSQRPRTRPERPQVVEATPEPAAEPTADPTDAIADAVAAAVADGAAQTPSAPTGPPLSRGEKEGLRVSVSKCWNVGSLSSEALLTTVIVAVNMSKAGKPDVASIRMVSSSGGSSGAANQAYEAARRAIIRCGASGFKLPAEKYSQWREIEMTFNPEKMRIK